MEAYKRETEKVIKRFLNHRLSFAERISALDEVLDDLHPTPTADELDALRSLILANNETVMKEMERRGPP